MERTQSLENLSKVNHDLRNTVGRQARRAAQAAAPLPNPTRLTTPNPTKLPENVPPFSTLNPSSSMAVSTAVGVPSQSGSRILTFKQSHSPPPQVPPTNTVQLGPSQAREIEYQPHPTTQISISAIAAGPSSVTVSPTRNISFSSLTSRLNVSGVGQTIGALSGVVSGAFSGLFRSPPPIQASEKQPTFKPWLNSGPTVVDHSSTTTASALTLGAISGLGFAPSSVLLLAQSAQVPVPTTSVRAVQIPEDSEDHTQTHSIKPESDQAEADRPPGRRILQQQSALSPQPVVFELLPSHLVPSFSEVKVQSFPLC